MSCFKPGAWGWAALAIVILIVYFSQLGRRQRPVATLKLWQRALARRPAWFILRHWASLLTQVLLVAVFAAALSEPYIKQLVAARRNMVLILDVSASMSATDGRHTRWARLKAEARRIINDVHRGERLALVAVGSTIRTVCRFTEDHQALHLSLEDLQATDGTTRVAEAIDLARGLLAGQTNPRIIVLSDGCFPGAGRVLAADDVQFLGLGEQTSNVAITRLESRPQLKDPAMCEVFVEVQNLGSDKAARTLTIGMQNGKQVTEKLTLAANGQWRKVLQMATGAGGLLSARLNEDDALASDNAAHLLIPGRHQPTVTAPGSIPVALQAALKLNPRINFVTAEAGSTAAAKTGSKSAAGSAPAGVQVLYRQIPQPLPAGPLIVIEPQDSCELWELAGSVRDAKCAVQAARADSPLLAGVDFFSCVIEQAVRVKFSQAAETLVTAASGDALYSALDRPGGRVLVLHANLEKTDLPRRFDFARLLDNGVQWLLADETTDLAAATTSEAVLIEPAQAARQVTTPDGWQTSLAAEQTQVVLDRAGVWSLAGDESRGDAGPKVLVSNLANAQESDLRPATELKAGEYTPSPPVWDQPLWMLLVGVGIVLLVVEWYLFHRRVVV